MKAIIHKLQLNSYKILFGNKKTYKMLHQKLKKTIKMQKSFYFSYIWGKEFKFC